MIDVKQHGSWSQVGVKWDNGRKLMLVVPPDQFDVIPDDTKK